MAGTDERLVAFVGDGLRQGIPRAELTQALTQAGWADAQVKDALRQFADVGFPIPVPAPRPYLSAREAFLYLVLFTTLYITAYNLGRLLIHIIDHLLPDPTDRLIGLAERIRWSVSALVVAFPVFGLLGYRIGRAVRADPTKRASRVRKWLTYMTLFVAATALLCDFTLLVYNVLGGEATTRFVLKVLVVAGIAGTIFGYYMWDLRAEEREP